MENNSHYYSPLRYPGGKATLFNFFSTLLRENNLIGYDYAEPYAGGSGLALKLLMKEYVATIHINDLDVSIYSFWHSILNHNTRFCDWIENIDVTIENWKYYKQIQRTKELVDPFELAKSTFYLNRTNVSGVIKGGIIGGLSQKGKYKMDVRFNKKDLINRIRRIEKFKRRIKIYNKDGVNFVKAIDKKQANTILYIDPPYYLKGSELYMNFFKEKDHKRLLKQIDKINSNWVISYDNNEFIIDLYKNYKTMSYDFKQSASNRMGHELLIFQDNIKTEECLKQIQNPHSVKYTTANIRYDRITPSS